MGFFYFDFKDQSKQGARGVLSSLLIQLAAQSNDYCESLSALYSAYDAGSQQPSEYALRECLRSMVAPQNRGPIFFVIDAIDECPNSTGTPSPRETVLELLEWLLNLKCPHLSVCVTSRPEADIEAVFRSLASYTVSLHGESGQARDIEEYIRFVVNTDPKMRAWSAADKELVIETLMKKADGM